MSRLSWYKNLTHWIVKMLKEPKKPPMPYSNLRQDQPLLMIRKKVKRTFWSTAKQTQLSIIHMYLQDTLLEII